MYYSRILAIFLYGVLITACNSALPQQPLPSNLGLVGKVTDTLSLPIPPKYIYIIDYDTTQWTDVGLLDTSIVLDLRYATTNNFVDTQLYDCPRCFLRPKVAEVIVEIQSELQAKGYGLKLFDCYRPRPIQWSLWNKVPDRRYVADPRKGSMHNRGLAVDLTLTDSQGKQLDMGTEFDYFGQKAYHSYTAHSEEVAANRSLLKSTMEQHNFRSTRTEWWHYSFRGNPAPLSDMLWSCEQVIE